MRASTGSGSPLLVAVMVLIPVALTFARDDGYESRVALYKDGSAGGDQHPRGAAPVHPEPGSRRVRRARHRA